MSTRTQYNVRMGSKDRQRLKELMVRWDMTGAEVIRHLILLHCSRTCSECKEAP